MWVLFAHVPLLSELINSLSSIIWRQRAKVQVQESWYDHSSAGEVYKKHGKKKKESPKELTVPDLGKANAVGKGGEAKDGPDQPVIDIPWLGAHPVPGPGVARKGC